MRGARTHKCVARLDRPLQPFTKKVHADARGFVEIPNTRDDLRGRAVSAPSLERSGAGPHFDRITPARIAFDPLHRTRENPWVPAQERPLSASFENQPRHISGAMSTTMR